MGGLISYISSQNHSEDIFLDFEKAQPQTEEEKEIHANVSAVLNKGPDILEKLSTYAGCEEHIRKVFF